MNTYTDGELVKCTGTFKDENDVVADPSTVTFVYETPAGAVTELVYGTDAEVVKDSTGVYYVNLDTTGVPGTWKYRFFSSGNGQAAAQSKFKVMRAVPVP